MRRVSWITIGILLVFMQLSVYAQDNLSKDNDLKTKFQNNEAIIYVINIRTFNAQDTNCNGIIDIEDGETPGTFINAIERLDELEELGINAVHVLPITPTGRFKALGTAGSLYSMSDLTSINPQLEVKGCDLSLMEQAKLFVSECHRRGIRVIIDLPSCGAYDMFMNQPDLFAIGRDGQPVIPSDWIDVRLFRTKNQNGTLNEDLFELHKRFVDMMLEIEADGIRADVATIKPYEFWVNLIKYARDKDPEFLFLAEASDSWTQPPSPYSVFTNYRKLLDAGFDGFYGSYFNLKNWKSVNELKSQVDLINGINQKSKTKKSVIGSFATHDELSPIVAGGENLSINMVWLNATLPLNPYYVDGFLTGDTYIYPYSNQKSKMTYTDDDDYYVHKGKIDIFNFSRKPGGNNQKILEEYKLAAKLREYSGEVVTKGSFKPLKTTNSNVFAFARCYNNRTLIVIFNKNLDIEQNAKIYIPKLSTDTKILPIKISRSPEIENGKMELKLQKGETTVFFIENFKI